MTEDQFREHIRWIQTRLPGTYATLTEDGFLRAWFNDFFCQMEDQDACLGRLAMVNEEILPNGERFMSRWYQHAKRHESERLRRESRVRVAIDHSKAVREVLESGHCKRIYEASLQIPWDRSEPWEFSERKRFIDEEFRKLDEAGIKY